MASLTAARACCCLRQSSTSRSALSVLSSACATRFTSRSSALVSLTAGRQQVEEGQFFLAQVFGDAPLLLGIQPLGKGDEVGEEGFHVARA